MLKVVTEECSYTKGGGIKIPIGTVLEVNQDCCGWAGMQVIGGKYRSLYIPKEKSRELEPGEFNTMMDEQYQELLKRREEVRALTYKVEAHEAGRKRAESAADRLERELQEAREAKKVPLPQEVAEAIDRLKVGISPFGIAKFVARRSGPDAAIICDWINSAAPLEVADRYQLLMEALVNGYTVEENKDDLFISAVDDLVKGWKKGPGGALALEITKLHKSIYGEQPANG